MGINVLVVDDMEEYRNYFSLILKKQADMKVVGTASGGSEAVALAKRLAPDVVLMDIQMETDNSGIAAAKEIVDCLPDTKVIILTIHGTRDNVVSAYDSGVTDFVLKTSPPKEIVTAIRDAMSCNTVTENVNKIVKDEMIRMKKERESFLYCANLLSRLSKSEIEILKMLCAGKKYREIADARFVEEVTIRGMVSKISKKLSGRPIREIIRQLKQNGIADMLDKYF